MGAGGSRGDAIGDSARQVRDMLRAAGHTSDIFALTIDDDLRGDVRPFADPRASRGDVTIFHFALPSPMTEAFAASSGARVLQYHNITPAAFFAPYDAAAVPAGGARPPASSQRSSAASISRSATPNSIARELEALGFAPTGVLPIAVDTGARSPARRGGPRSKRSSATA